MSNDSINNILNTLSEKERKYALEILKEYSDKGSSETYNNLLDRKSTRLNSSH